MLLKKIILIFITLLISTPVWAATPYYVSTTGSGITCSSGSPCLLSYAITQAVNTDTIYFKNDDTWTGQATLLTTVAGVTYDGSAYGSGTRATLRATSLPVGGTELQQAVIRIGTSNVTVKGFELDGNDLALAGIQIAGYSSPTADISDITVDNCLIYNIGTSPGSDDNNASWSSGIDISPRREVATGHRVDRVTITNTTIHDTVRNAIAVYPAWSGTYNPSGDIVDTVTIRGCTIYNAGNNGGMGHIDSGIGIHIKSDADNVTVEYCSLYNNTNSGIYIEAFASDDTVAPNNMVIRYNIIYTNGNDGIAITNPSAEIMSGDFYGNIFYNNCATSTTYCAEFGMGNNNLSTSTFNIYNNTFYSTSGSDKHYGLGIGTAAGVPTGTPTINFKNNIVYMGDYAETFDKTIWDGGNFLVHSNNLIYRTTSTDAYVYDGTTNFTDANVTTWEASAQKTNPTFTEGTLPTGFSGTYGTNMVPNTNYFSISSGNAINNGATLGSPYNGMINSAGFATPLTRPQGSAYDIGAYEFMGSLSLGTGPALRMGTGVGMTVK